MGREDDYTIESGADLSLSWELWWAGLGSILVFLAFLQYVQGPVTFPVLDAVTRGHRWNLIFPLVIAGMAYAAMIAYLHDWWRDWGRDWGKQIRVHRFLYLSAPLVCACVAWLVWVSAIPGARDLGRNYVGGYCAWGAVSERQFRECLNHVTIDEVDRLDTVAAKFARREHHPCGPGIYCYEIYDGG